MIEVVMDYMKLLSQNLPGETEENHETSQLETPGLESHLVPLEYKSGALTSQLLR
jgi:hypothetical protein